MEIPKLPSAGPASGQGGAGGAGAAGGAGGGAGPDGSTGLAFATADGVDRVDIRALDLPAVLLILTTEILDQLGLAPAAVSGTADPTQAAVTLVSALLRAFPADGADAGAWSTAEQALQSGIAAGFARATAIIQARPPDPAVVAGMAATHALVAVLAEDAPPGFPLGPEWSGLLPRLDAFRRRRRKLRRRWLDPDTEAPRGS